MLMRRRTARSAARTAATAAILLMSLPIAAGLASAQSSPATKIVVNGVELHYISQGQGEPVILLHGGQGDYRAWPSLVEALAPRFHVVSYSRRHHWPNTNPIDGSNHSALVDAEDLAGLIGALRLGPAHLVGTSYGAFTALALALEHPRLVRSLVLAEPPVHLWVTGTERGAALYRDRVAKVHEPARKAFAAGQDEEGMRLFIDTFDGPGTFDRLPAERRAMVMANARFFKVITSSSDPFPNLSKEAVRRLQIPVLIVRGAETEDLYKLVVEELARLLPAARRLVVPEAGHGSPRQNPRAFNAAVLDFLAQARSDAESR